MKNTLSSLIWLVGAAAATGLAYVLILEWNAKKSLVPEEPGAVGTECVGPYDSWQVIALAAVLAAIVVAGTLARHHLVVPGVVVTTLVALFTVDALTVDDPCADNNLLPVGVLLLFAGSTIAAAGLVAVTRALTSRGSPIARPSARP